MSNRIKGITIVIGGDTTRLDKALKDTNQQIKSTQASLRDVERLLKMDPGNITLLEQRQRLLSSATEDTAQKLRTLHKAAEDADAALARGKAYEEKYAPLKVSLDEVGGKLEKLKARQDQIDDAFVSGTLPDSAYQKFNQTLVETQAEYDNLIQAQKALHKEFAGTKLNQDQYDALQREIVETEERLKSLEKKAAASSVALNRMSAAANKVSSGARKVADITRPLSTSILAVGAAAVATVPATEELRSDLSKLDNNARAAGLGVDIAREAFKAFAIATDETDSSVEAVSNLLQAGFTKSNLQTAVEGLTGAYLAFPDTLKIESLADSLQETLATGKAVGQFGELLDRLGVGAENFSATLAQITDEASKQQYALDTLAKSGMVDYYNSWVASNQALVENKDANLELQESMSRLAESIQPIITDITKLATAFLDWFNGLSDGGKKAIVTILGLLASISPIAGTVASISYAIAGVTKVAELFSSTAGNTMYLTFAKWALIIVAVSAALAALIAMINILIGKGDDVTSTLNAVNGSSVNTSRPGRRMALPVPADVPGFASGGVFAPNSPFLGVLGDNRTEYEVAAPESMLKETFLEALRSQGGGRPQAVNVNIRFTGSLAQLGRVLQPVVVTETQRQGPRV